MSKPEPKRIKVLFVKGYYAALCPWRDGRFDSPICYVHRDELTDLFGEMEHDAVFRVTLEEDE